MTDIVVTAANVLLNQGSLNAQRNCAGVVSQGDVVSLDASNKWVAAQSDVSALIAGTNGIAIALNTTSADAQPLTVVESGAKVAYGTGVLAAGETYVVSSAAAGGIAPIGDLAAGDFTVIVGYAEDTSILVIQPVVTNLARGTAVT